MIYAIMLCIANVGCHMLGEPVYTYTFASPEACLAKLPVVLVRGKSVSADGRLYLNKQEWLECDGKQTWQTVTPAAPAVSVNPGPKSYTIAICPKNGGDCTQVLPAIHETIRDCALKLYDQTIGARPAEYDLEDGHIYLHGNRDVWMQCYDTKQH